MLERQQLKSIGMRYLAIFSDRLITISPLPLINKSRTLVAQAFVGWKENLNTQVTMPKRQASTVGIVK